MAKSDTMLLITFVGLSALCWPTSTKEYEHRLKARKSRQTKKGNIR